jgi:hypothetical protein
MPTMPNQLAPNSVRTYHLPPEAYATARNKVLRQIAVVFAGMVLFALVLAYKMFGQTWHQNSIASLLPTIVFVLLFSGALVAGFRKGIKRNQESWDSFELVVGEDFVITRKKDFPELEIQRHEVTRIRESATGLYVETKFKDRTIGIARALTDYEDARERLSRWMPLVREPPRGWTAPTRWMWTSPVITIFLFALVLMSTNNWVVVAAGVPLLIGLSVGIWVIRRSVQTSAHTKRVSLLTVLPLLAIIARLIQAIQRLR